MGEVTRELVESNEDRQLTIYMYKQMAQKAVLYQGIRIMIWKWQLCLRVISGTVVWGLEITIKFPLKAEKKEMFSNDS